MQNQNLRNETRLQRTASRNVQSRNVVDVGGIWIDDGFDPKMETVTVKALSKAYFRLLELHPYDVPEIVAWPVAEGLPDYLNWVVTETRPE